MLSMHKCDLILLEKLDFLIIKRKTGTTENLANVLNISRRSVFNYLNILREMGAEIV